MDRRGFNFQRQEDGLEIEENRGGGKERGISVKLESKGIWIEN